MTQVMKMLSRNDLILCTAILACISGASIYSGGLYNETHRHLVFVGNGRRLQ